MRREGATTNIIDLQHTMNSRLSKYSRCDDRCGVRSCCNDEVSVDMNELLFRSEWR